MNNMLAQHYIRGRYEGGGIRYERPNSNFRAIRKMELMEALSRHLSEDDVPGPGARNGKTSSQRFGG